MQDPLGDWISVTRPWGAELGMLRVGAGGLAERPSQDGVALIVVSSGRVTLDIDGQRWEMEAGDTALRIDGAAHRVIGVEESTLLLGVYQGSRCPVTSLWAGTDALLLLRNPGRQSPQIATLTALMVDELKAPDAGAGPLVGGLLDALMVALLRFATTACPHTHGWIRGLRDPVVAPALRTMHDAPRRNWTLLQLAKAVGVSRSLLAKRFTESIGEPPMRYLRRWRMSLAARLLLENDLDIEAIAAEVGYQSPYAFSRAFKLVVGLPPGRFRQVGVRLPGVGGRPGRLSASDPLSAVRTHPDLE